MRSSTWLILWLAAVCVAAAVWVSRPAPGEVGQARAHVTERVSARGDGQAGERTLVREATHRGAGGGLSPSGDVGRREVAGPTPVRLEPGAERGVVLRRDVNRADIEERVLTGRVLDAARGRPVADAVVELRARKRVVLEARSDVDGRFALKLGTLAGQSGWWAAVAQGAFALGSGAEVELVVATPAHVDFREFGVDFESWEQGGERGLELVPSGALTGRVAFLGPAPPDVVAYVELFHKTGPSAAFWMGSVQACDAQGGFTFGDLDPGEYALLAKAVHGDGVGNARGVLGDMAATERMLPLLKVESAGANWVGRFEASVEVRSGEQQEFDLELAQGARLVGRALPVDANGSAVQFESRTLTLTLVPVQIGMPEELALRERTEVEVELGAAFELDGLSVGTYRLDYEPEWGGRKAVMLEVARSGERLERDLLVATPAFIEGRVFGVDGERAGGAVVSLRAAGSQAVQHVSTDARGAFSFDSVPTGKPLTLAARVNGVGEAQAFVPALASAERSGAVELQLEPYRTLRGVVEAAQLTGPNGDRLPGAMIVAEQKRGGLTFTELKAATDATGAFMLQNLRREPTVFHVTRQGFVESSWSCDLTADAPEIDGQSLEGQVTFALEPALQVAGNVRDEFGALLPGVFLVAQVDERFAASVPFGTRLTQSDELGRFRFPGLPAADWHIAPQDPAWLVVASDPPRIDAARTSQAVELVLRRRAERTKASIAFEVVRASDGAVPPGLSIVGARDAAVHVDGGRVHISGADPNLTSLLVVAEGCAAQRLALMLTPGAQSSLGLVELGVGVAVEVVLTGAPPSGNWSLELVPLAAANGGPPAGTPRVRLVDEGDAFRIRNLPEGRCRLRLLDGNGEVASEVVDLYGDLFEHTMSAE